MKSVSLLRHSSYLSLEYLLALYIPDVLNLFSVVPFCSFFVRDQFRLRVD